jgi:hypothetical protein
MKKTVLTFGLISGTILAVMIVGSMPFEAKIGFAKAEIIGYTTLVLAALLVFFGVRSYRENVSGGRLSFARGFAVGILITLVSSFCYVTAWEVTYFGLMPDFGDKYAAHMIDRAKASGASQQTIDKKVQEAQQFSKSYRNPAINVAYTFMEVFPVGLAATLLSAAILRRKAARQAAVS